MGEYSYCPELVLPSLKLPIHTLYHHSVDTLIWASLRAKDPQGSGKVAMRQTDLAQLARVKPVSVASVLRRMRQIGLIRGYRWKKVRGHLTYTIYFASLQKQHVSCGGLVVTKGELKRMQKLSLKELRIRAVHAATDFFQRAAEMVWFKRQQAVQAIQMGNRQCKRYRQAVMPEVISAATLFDLSRKNPTRLCPWVKLDLDEQEEMWSERECQGRRSLRAAATDKKSRSSALCKGSLVYEERFFVNKHSVIISKRQRVAAVGQQFLADKLGVTREYVNRCLQNKPRFHVFQDWGTLSAQQVKDNTYDPQFYGPQFFVQLDPLTGMGRLYRRLPCLYQSIEHVRSFWRSKKRKQSVSSGAAAALPESSGGAPGGGGEPQPLE